MTLLHNVYFWLKADVSADQRVHFEREVRRLTELDYVADGFVGRPAPTEKRPVNDHSFDYSLSLRFKTDDDHVFYQKQCPGHRRFIDQCAPMFERVVVYDSTPLA
jgi:Stress responsive A/B Barrel Domain